MFLRGRNGFQTTAREVKGASFTVECVRLLLRLLRERFSRVRRMYSRPLPVKSRVPASLSDVYASKFGVLSACRARFLEQEVDSSLLSVKRKVPASVSNVCAFNFACPASFVNDFWVRNGLQITARQVGSASFTVERVPLHVHLLSRFRPRVTRRSGTGKVSASGARCAADMAARRLSVRYFSRWCCVCCTCTPPERTSQFAR